MTKLWKIEITQNVQINLWYTLPKMSMLLVVHKCLSIV